MNQYILIAILLVGVFAFWTFVKNSGTAGGVRINPSDAIKNWIPKK